MAWAEWAERKLRAAIWSCRNVEFARWELLNRRLPVLRTHRRARPGSSGVSDSVYRVSLGDGGGCSSLALFGPLENV